MPQGQAGVNDLGLVLNETGLRGHRRLWRRRVMKCEVRLVMAAVYGQLAALSTPFGHATLHRRAARNRLHTGPKLPMTAP